MAKRCKYREGDWFAVPLRSGGYAVGVVARTKGAGVLGYFFGPRWAAAPAPQALATLRPDASILISVFGDLGLINGEWPIIGRLENWDRNEWPMPVFARVDSLDPGKCLRITYADDDPNLSGVVKEEVCSPEEASRLLPEAMSGYGAIEIKLTHLLCG